MLSVTLAGWAVTIGLIVGLLTVDWFLSAGDPRSVGMRQALAWSAFYIGVAVLFGVVFGLIAGWDAGGQYFAGYVVEKSLSIDNLFVFVIIIAALAVPAELKRNALTIGIALALALPFTSDYRGSKLATHEEGRLVLTPMLLVLVAIGSTDLLFAFDSIPAVFGVTQDTYIVLCANAFALLGLRALFFLVAGGRGARPARLPLKRSGGDTRLHRREAHPSLRTQPERQRPRDIDPTPLPRSSSPSASIPLR